MKIIYSQVWTSPEKGYQIFASFSVSQFNKSHDSTGNSIELSPIKIQSQTVQAGGQYGISDKWTIRLRLPYHVFNTIADENDSLSEIDSLKLGSIGGFGNIEVGALYKIREKEPFINASVSIETATHIYDFYSGIATGYRAFTIKPGIALAGHYVENFWYSVYTAADIKTNQYSSGILATAEVGYKLKNIFYGAVSADSRFSFDNGSYCDCNLYDTGIFFNNQQYAALNFKAGVILNQMSVNLGLTSGIYSVNIPGNAIVTFGLIYKSY